MGLGAPSARGVLVAARVMPGPVTPAPASPAPAACASPAPSSASALATADERFDETPPQADFSKVAGLAPWPRLNPEASIAKAWRLAEGPHRAPGDRRRLVTLTFDDGPFPETTPRVLDLLDKYDVSATFFVLGLYLDGEDDRARASRDVLRDIVARGHLVGNHTHDHALLTKVSRTKVLAQIDRGSSSIERAIGKRPILFRPPYGQLDAFGQEAVRARGLDVLLWNVEAKDMERSDTSEMFADLVRQLSYNEGGVVLLHDIRPSSVTIAQKLLAYLDARRFDPARPEREGYEIVDLPTYLRAVEASPPQQGAREARRAKAKKRVSRR